MLYGVNTDPNILSYPRDLNNNPAKQHVIQFTIMERVEPTNQGKTIGSLATGATELASTVLDDVKNKISTTSVKDIGGILSSKGKEIYNEFSIENVTTKLENVSTEALTAAGKFVSGQLTSKGVTRKSGKRINLYIPDGLNVGYSSDYTTSSLTETLGQPYFFAQLGASVKDALGKGVGNIGVNDITGNPYLRQLAAQKAPLIGGAGLVGPALAAEGYAVNPQLQVLFTGIGFRQFRFEFTLTPYSQEEAETIKKIVSYFKYAAAPEIERSKYFDQGMFYRVPDPVRIAFLFAGKENLNIPKIEECVIRNVDVQYTPMGWATFADGNPVQTKMTLDLEETVLIDKNKIKEGY